MFSKKDEFFRFYCSQLNVIFSSDFTPFSSDLMCHSYTHNTKCPYVSLSQSGVKQRDGGWSKGSG